MTPPTCPVAPTTATLTPCAMSATRPCVDHGLALGVEVEGSVHRSHGIVELVGAGHDGHADLRGGDHLDVDPGVAQRPEELRGDARARLHARAHERELADLVVVLDR